MENCARGFAEFLPPYNPPANLRPPRGLAWQLGPWQSKGVTYEHLQALLVGWLPFHGTATRLARLLRRQRAVNLATKWKFGPMDLPGRPQRRPQVGRGDCKGGRTFGSRHGFVSLLLARGDTAAPSGLLARLCHTFLVFNVVPNNYAEDASFNVQLEVP